MRRWGINPEDCAPPPVPVWPENKRATRVFLAMRTQWRVGMSGYTGLDYSALAEVWSRLGIPRADRDVVFYELQVIEQGALEAIHAKD